MKYVQPILYPYLFASFPVVFLYSHNVDKVLISQVVRPLLCILVVSFIVSLLFRLCIPNKHRASLVLTLLLIYFFTYGHIYQALEGISVGGLKVAQHGWLAPGYTLLFVILIIMVVGTRIRMEPISRIASSVGCALMIIPLSQISFYHIRSIGSHGIPRKETLALPVISTHKSSFPNIFYIVVDEHLGNDALRSTFGFDNCAFYEQLRKRGFYVKNRARSNYPRTEFSLASSLNYQYHDDLTNELGISSQDMKPIIQRLQYNKVFAFLRQQGYTLVSFATGFGPTEFHDADIYKTNHMWLDEFTINLINSTIVIAMGKDLSFAHIAHRYRTLYTLDHLGDTAEIESPFCVFAHIICPHMPYVFDEDGRILHPKGLFRWHDVFTGTIEEHRRGYLGQLKYLDKRLLNTIDEILTRSVRPPVIIIQSDHGIKWHLNSDPTMNSNMDYKINFSILNAYYLPGFKFTEMPETMTPVNTFRLILNHYFGADLALVEDRSFYNAWPRPYDFVDVTDKVNEGDAGELNSSQ